MADQKPKGSILYELLIVILVAALIGTILYPKSLWDKEEANTELCRERMMHILEAELLYIENFNTYTDSLPKLTDFILSDTTFELLRTFIERDSLLVADIVDHVRDDISKEKVIETLRSVINEMDTDTIAVNYLSVEKYNQRMPHVPIENFLGDWKMGVVDTLYLDTLMVNVPLLQALDVGMEEIDNKELIATLWFTAIDIYDFERPEEWILKNFIWKNPEFVEVADAIARETLGQMILCPTVHDSMQIAVIDTTVIKHLQIACPIDSAHAFEAREDFLKSKIGGLHLKNHGYINDGEKSWTKQDQ